MIVGVDVGGTNLRVAEVGADGEVGARRSRETPRGDAAALVDALAEEVEALADETGRRPERLGVAVAGFVDLRGGRVLRSPGLELVDAELAGPLRERLALPVRLVNDVNAAAFGEASVRGADELVAIFVGTGVGTGFVSGGRLLEGAHGMAAEGGHLPWRQGGERCGCGRQGCVEVFLGGRSVARRAGRRGLDDDTSEVVAAARAGQAPARALVDDACAAMAWLADVLTTLLDPRVLVVGGGFGLAAPELVEAARDGAARRRGGEPPRVETSRLGDDAGLVGAAVLARAASG